MKSYKDQMVRTVRLPAAPKRIVCLVPSLTELLFTLELEEAVVGITRFCVHPEHWQRTKTRIGGTKNVSVEAVRILQPDLIIASKEENVYDQVIALQKFAPVWVSDVFNMTTALEAIAAIAEMCNRQAQAQALLRNIQAGFDLITPVSPVMPVTYLIWKDPYMVPGGDTYINDMLRRCGFSNTFSAQCRYPTVSLYDIRNFGGHMILLSTEPYPFNEKHRLEMMELVPGVPVKLVNGEMFSWYGSRMLPAVSYFCELTGSI